MEKLLLVVVCQMIFYWQFSIAVRNERVVNWIERCHLVVLVLIVAAVCAGVVWSVWWGVKDLNPLLSQRWH